MRRGQEELSTLTSYFRPDPRRTSSAVSTIRTIHLRFKDLSLKNTSLSSTSPGLSPWGAAGKRVSPGLQWVDLWVERRPGRHPDNPCDSVLHPPSRSVL